ncbi:nuclear transport factor 2 family protein [Synechococcus sp. CC9311]|uniref:nuclear transport factor 2 family protein n=1 Tax=Synechococcus sp. (strain CC9311) TaxID=64471 RepID=UPI0011D0CB11|nr:nuclear transport factor 2 family protein [Synechococcus sp. CC9311]
MIKSCFINTQMVKVIKTLFYASLLSLIYNNIAYSSPAPRIRWGNEEDTIVQYINAADKLWQTGNCMANAGMTRYLSDEFHGTWTSGERYNKSTALETGANKDCVLGDVKVKFFGENVAIAYGSESYMSKEIPSKKTCLAWTDTWLKYDGRWQIIAAQDNVVPCVQ